jgi:hypothetical protein
MGIFIICIDIIGPLSHFDCNNFKASINFDEIKNMVHLVIFVIFHVNMITCQNCNLPQIYHILVEKNSLFEMKNFKLITCYPNMVQTMSNDMVKYIFNIHKSLK